MATLEDQVIALTASVATLTTKVEALAIPAAPAVDLTPVLTAIATLQADITAIQAQFVPTAPAA